MTEAVPLDELLHEEAIFGLAGVRKVGVPQGCLFPSGLCLSAIPRVVWARPDPIPTRLKRVGKNVQTLWWAELDRLHSMTRAHPPLGRVNYQKLLILFIAVGSFDSAIVPENTTSEVASLPKINFPHFTK